VGSRGLPMGGTLLAFEDARARVRDQVFSQLTRTTTAGECSAVSWLCTAARVFTLADT
jgi:hypothetical protein